LPLIDHHPEGKECRLRHYVLQLNPRGFWKQSDSEGRIKVPLRLIYCRQKPEIMNISEMSSPDVINCRQDDPTIYVSEVPSKWDH
ncbi:hypothetical protein NPIL_147381, partial [Nephila pilipes]